MEEQYKKRMKWRFGESGAESQVDHYLELFPELKGRLSKFESEFSNGIWEEK